MHIYILLNGYLLVNDLQIPPHSPYSKRAYGKIFLAHVSDDFKTKKILEKIKW